MQNPYGSLPDHLLEMLEAIKTDNRSGAAELLQKAAAVYETAASSPQARLPPEDQLGIVERISSALGEAQPGMAGLLNLIKAVRNAVHRSAEARPLHAAGTAAVEFAASAEQGAAAAAARAAQLISGSPVVLTHSRSSTVLAALREAAGNDRTFSLIATESRPMLEGRQLAEAVFRAGIHVTVIVDAAAALAMDTVDLVLVGADRVTPEHALNKIGTLMIALAARHIGTPVYCLADTSKFISSLQALPEESARSGVEVWPEIPAGISIMNRYFEEVPIGLFTGVVTESGLLAPSDAARLAAGS